MKLSQETKTKALEYMQRLKTQIEAETGCEPSNKTLQPLKQWYQFQLHTKERNVRLAELWASADDLGYVLVKKSC